MKIRALLAGLLCAMGLMFVTGCGDSPEKAFKEIREGFSKGDAAKVKSRVAKNSPISSWIDAIIKEPEFQEMWKSAEIVSSTVNGDKATVKVKMNDGKEKVEDCEFVKEDGKWKLVK